MKLLSLAVLACAISLCAAQYEYDYSYGYDFYDNDFYAGDAYGGDMDIYGFEDGEFAAYDSEPSSTATPAPETSGFTTGPGGTAYGSYYDEYGYYGDEDMAYYEYYGYYADDAAGGYDDYYAEEYDFFEECFFDAAGKPALADGSATCDIKITGVDKQAKKLSGGINGIYQLTSCYNGKPMYRRKDSPANEERVLWYSSTFGDWDISKGTDPNEAEILMYGGEMEHASTPLFVSGWHLGGDLLTEEVLEEDSYKPIDCKVVCADGTKYEEDPLAGNKQTGPVLTDEEMEAKYRFIYDKYSKANTPSPAVNFSFVVLLVMVGITIVLAIPYFLLKKPGGKKGKGVAASFAQMLQQSRKKASGHDK